MTRRKFTNKFKTKVVLEALKEQSSVAELLQKHDQEFTTIAKTLEEVLGIEI